MAAGRPQAFCCIGSPKSTEGSPLGGRSRGQWMQVQGGAGRGLTEFLGLRFQLAPAVHRRLEA